MFMKGALYYKLENMTVALGPKIRKLGQQYFNQGMALQGPMGHQDTLVPSLRCIPISNTCYPKTLDADFVAPNAVLVGDIKMGTGSSAWHGTTLRGDTASIQIGKNSIIQDNSHIGSSERSSGDKVNIGDNVYVGANAKLQPCELESFAYVGMGASVGRGATVESFGVVAAGANVPDGTTVPSGQIYAGSPAVYLRDLTQSEKHLIGEHHFDMQQLAQVYNDMTEMTFREQQDHFEQILQHRFQDPQEKIQEKLYELGMPVTHEDINYIEHRVYHDYVGTVDYDLKDPGMEEDALSRSWTPYEQDLTQYPEVFKKYQENYDKYDRIKKRFEDEDPYEEQGESAFTKKAPRDNRPWDTKYDTVLPRYTGTSCQ